MKSLMYHYVRNFNKEYPYSNYLDKKIFIKQIKSFSKKGIISDSEEIFTGKNKFILTFDDGLRDHLWVSEELKKNNCIGIFFIPTLPFEKKEILAVHKTHLILSKVGGKPALEKFNYLLRKKKIKNLINSKEKSRYVKAYKLQKNIEETTTFKKIMNYYGNFEIINKILNELMKYFEINISSRKFYLTKKEIKHMVSLGMVIGGHTHNHILLSRLNYKKQFNEISTCKKLLEKITKKECNLLSFPYGREYSYNRNTINILKKLNFKNAFSVDYRNINKNDLKNKSFELPRYDCNLFTDNLNNEK